ncbi:MAG: hypothetical protein AAGL69_01215 [Pseudomonadota bacterium]
MENGQIQQRSKPEASLNGSVIGYDPGGNKKRGLAVLELVSGRTSSFTTKTLASVGHVLAELDRVDDMLALGVDTLAARHSGESGWRPADLWLRETYEPVAKSVVSPNGLYGSMGLNGMHAMIHARDNHPNLPITETHPKVLFFALTDTKYDYENNHADMDAAIAGWLGVPATTRNDHEWDALISAYAALQGLRGTWPHDLLDGSMEGDDRLRFPCGRVNYWWPE